MVPTSRYFRLANAAAGDRPVATRAYVASPEISRNT